MVFFCGGVWCSTFSCVFRCAAKTCFLVLDSSSSRLHVWNSVLLLHSALFASAFGLAIMCYSFVVAGRAALYICPMICGAWPSTVCKRHRILLSLTHVFPSSAQHPPPFEWSLILFISCSFLLSLRFLTVAVFFLAIVCYLFPDGTLSCLQPCLHSAVVAHRV